MQNNEFDKERVAQQNPQQSPVPIKLIDLSTEKLMYLYAILMSPFNANAYSFKSSLDDGQQLLSPDLKTTLSVYVDLLEDGVIKLFSTSKDIAGDPNADNIENHELKGVAFEINQEKRQANNRICSAIKKELIKRAKEKSDFHQAGFRCWQILNQAYCFNAIAYRFESFGIDPGEREFTTAEYIDFKELAGQLSIDWINTLCHRAFNWTAGKQKENGMPDSRAANLAISSVLRQYAWAVEEPPLGKPFVRPKTLAVFGLERIFKDFFGITPTELFKSKPDLILLQERLNQKYLMGNSKTPIHPL